MTETPEPKRFKILFLCTGNSARSILAEYFLRRLDPVHFETFSAGANPRGRVNPYVLELLKDGYHIDASGARSKSWEEYRDVRVRFRHHRLRQGARVLPGLARPADRGALGVGGSGRCRGLR